MIKCIVCPVDGSEHADKAVKLAVDLASRYDAKLCLLHVYMRGMTHSQLEQFSGHAHLEDILIEESNTVEEFLLAAGGTTDGLYLPPPSRDSITRIAEVILEDARQFAAKQLGDRVSIASVDGKAAEQIIKYAEDQNADMIVMGSRGLGEFRSLFLGSTSHEVSHSCNCTCVTVK